MYLKDKLTLATERIYSDEGFLQVPARISRSGIQNYTAAEMGLTDKEPDTIIRLYRPPEEVFSEDSLKSFANKPVTDNHPPKLVTADNAKKLSVGHAGPEVVRDGIYAKTTLHITDATAIEKIESGKVELSNGYLSDIDWTPGITPSGEVYDAVQRNIKGNHIAIVERGRAGPACRLSDNLPNGEKANMLITIDGVNFEVTDQVAQAVVKLQTRLSDAEEETKSKEEEAKKKEDEAEEAKKKADKTEDSLKAKLDDANSKTPNAKAIDKLVADRTELVDKVLKISPDIKWEGKDADTLRKEVVGEHCSNVKLDSVSKDYIAARFDMLVDAVNTNSQTTLDNAFTKIVSNDKDQENDNRPASVVAREKFMADSQNAWKKTGGAK